MTRADGTSKLLAVNSKVYQGDTLKTEADTYARIRFVDGEEMVLRPKTVFRLDAYSYNRDNGEHDNFLASLLKGGLRAVTGMLAKRNHGRFKMRTDVATIGIRGTHFGALLCNNDCNDIPTVNGVTPANGLHTDTAEGAIIISNAAGSIVVPAGSFSYTANSNAMPEIIPPSQGIRVTMPTAISYDKSNGNGVNSQKSSSCAIQ